MKIKVTELKKRLKEYEQRELIELVVEIFKSNKDVQNFLSSRFLGEEVIEVLYNNARKKVENEFFPERGFGRLRLADAKKVIADFNKATNDQKRTVDLMLFYVEQGVDFTCSYGDINESFYSSMAKMYHQVAMECDKDEELYHQLSSRLRNILSKVQGIGWGFVESLEESFFSIDWVYDEDEDE